MNYRVIIPSKTLSNLVPCVEAVLEHEPELGSFDFVIVDDGVEFTDDCLNNLLCNAQVIKGEKPFVFARNINIGIREAMKDPALDGVILLNDDALLESPGGFTLLVEEAAAHPEYGQIGATTDKTGQPLQWRRQCEFCKTPKGSCRVSPIPCPSCGAGLRLLDHIAWPCVYIPTATLRRLGLLDERYALPEKYGCEDLDYCEAVYRAGLKTGVHDFCFVNHSSLKSSFRGDPSAPGDFLPHLELCIAKWGGMLQCHPTAVNLLRRTA